LSKFQEPTLEGVEFPILGIAQAWNDLESGTLSVETYAAAPSRRGSPTAWRITRLPDPDDVRIQCDGSEFTRWRVVGDDAIEVESEVGECAFRIVTGYHGTPHERMPARTSSRVHDVSAGAQGAVVRPAALPGEGAVRGVPLLPGGCSCCAGGAAAPAAH
jgi:hypothetical protein